MKKSKTLLAVGTGLFLSLASMFDAFALNTRISFSDPSAAVGTEFNVVMKVSSVDGADIGDSVIELKYNTESLDFVSGTNAQETTDGLIKVVGKPGDSDTEFVYDIKFRAIKEGETTIIVENWGIHDTADNMATLDHRGTSTVTIAAAAESETVTSEGTEPTAQEIAQTLAPGETAEGETASVETLAGEPVNEGTGSEGTTAESGITVDGQSYELASDFDASLLPATFEKQEYNYKGQKVSAGVQADNPAILMYLLTSDGSGNLFFYDESHDAWSKYVNFTVASKAITVVPTTSDVIVPVGFKETYLDLNGNMVKGYIWESDTEHNYVIIYGMNAEGERHFYRYDLKEKTIQRYFEDPAIRGNTADYSDTVTYYRNLQKAYEDRGIKLYIAAGVALVLMLLLSGLLLKILVLDRREEQERKERRKIREKEVELDREAARKEIESLTANLPVPEPDASVESLKVQEKQNVNRAETKRDTGFVSGKRTDEKKKKSRKNTKSETGEVKLEPIEDLDEAEFTDSSGVRFVATANEIENLYPDTKEEENADEVSELINEREEKNGSHHSSPKTGDSFLFDKNASLTVSFIDEEGSRGEIPEHVSEENAVKGESVLKDETVVTDKNTGDDTQKKEDFAEDTEEFPNLTNIMNMNFQKEYYEDDEDYTPQDLEEITDRLNKNLGIDENVLELETLEENLVKKYDNTVIETALDESAKSSAEDYVVPIDENDFKKAVKSEEKQNVFTKFDTQEIDR